MSGRNNELSETAVLDFIRKASAPVSLREIAHELRLRHRGRRDLKKMVERLVRSDVLNETKGSRFVLSGARPPSAQSAPHPEKPLSPPRPSNLIAGRLVCHRDGYGFLIPDERVPSLAGDLFIGEEAMGGAMHGDHVLARIEKRRRDGRAEGRIVRIVRHANPTIVGQFRYGSAARGFTRGGALPFNYVIPYEERVTQHILIPSGEEVPSEMRATREMERTGGRRRAPSKPTPDARQKSGGLPDLDGAIVNVELTRYPTPTSSAQGRVIEILGQPGDFRIDVEIIIRKYHLPFRFAEEVQAEAARVPQVITQAEIAQRQDFRHLPIVTIDGETAKDFDDAVHVSKLANGHFELQVHIADVAHYVRPGSPLDREARVRGTSVYFPDRAVPMLPVELSNGICSLNPHVDRLVLSVLMEIDHRGEVVHATFTNGVIRSAERMTYTNVHLILEGDRKLAQRYGPLVEEFRRMKELALILNHKRQRRGSIDFDLPEPLIEFDEHGFMVRITRAERNIAHRIIEEFMLAANETVAGLLESHAVASLHRIHEKPDARKVIEFEEIAQTFGYSLGVPNLSVRRLRVGGERPVRRGGREHGSREAGRKREMAVELPPAFELAISPRHYQRLTEKISGKPEERIVSFLMLRSLKQARYSEASVGHFALAAPNYTHFTSPIRRYPDLIVHRILKWALGEGITRHEGSGVERKRESRREHPRGHDPNVSLRVHPERLHRERGPYDVPELHAIAVESSEAERRADDAERELMDWKKLEFMAERLGEEFDAIVISVTKWGFFVELTDLFIEGLVPIDSLAGDEYSYREPDRAIVGKQKRRAFHLGDRVRVRVDRIDSVLKKIQFSLV